MICKCFVVKECRFCKRCDFFWEIKSRKLLKSGWGKNGAFKMSESDRRIEPLFFKNADVEQEEGNYLTTLEICEAVAEVVDNVTLIDGAQRIGGLWRIYFLDSEARAQVLVTGISLRGIQINLKERNTFLIPKYGLMGPDVEKLETTRLYVRNIPLSYDNEVIANSLTTMGVQMLGSLKYVRARNKHGQLKNFKTGDRFADIIVPDEPLPKKKQMGIFTASLYHKEQKVPKSEIECGNCKEMGHLRRECPNDPVCFECLQSGHKRGSMLCPAFKDDEGRGENEKRDSDSNEEEEEEEEEEVEKGASGGEKGNPENSGIEAKQIPLTKWMTPVHSAPNTPSSSRAGSPARVRKAGEITPDESTSKEGKKQKKGRNNKNK